ncbi:MAG TPA: PEP-CTERM sorting domain-containing protein [Fimbriimonadaceae bacterium]|nr:PEP-CTERM sorting domain-containing protein [Fimbriimonadaceae bacterium]
MGTLAGGTEAYGEGINNGDVVVGHSTVSGNIWHGFVSYGSGLIDLNSIVDSSGSGWTIEDAHAVNDTGWIAATAHTGFGAPHAVILMPVPEPSSLLGLGIPLLAFGFRRKLRTGYASAIGMMTQK